VVIHGGRLAYADTLITPKAFQDGQPLKFGCSILMAPDNPAIEEIQEALIAAATAKFGRKSEWPKLRGLHRDPVLKDCADFPKIGDVPRGSMFVRASSIDPPGIVDHRVRPLNKADYRGEVYSGRYATVSVNAFAYMQVTGAGVSLGLGNIQLLGHGDRLGAPRPTPGDDFDPTELTDEDDDLAAEDGEDDDFERPPPPGRR
jgi:hypothetical protein